MLQVVFLLLFATVLLSLSFLFPPPSVSLPLVLLSVPLSLSLSLCCSVLLSPTNDASHPQTHQLTLFQSYRTSLAFPPSLSLSLARSLWVASRVSRISSLLYETRYRAAESTVVTYASSLPFSSRPSLSLSLPFSSLFIHRVVDVKRKAARYKHRRRRRSKRPVGVRESTDAETD